MKLIVKRQPDFFVLENVKGLYQTKKHKIFYEQMKKRLYRAGYSLFDSIENALEYGVSSPSINTFSVPYTEREDSERISDTQLELTKHMRWIG